MGRVLCGTKYCNPGITSSQAKRRLQPLPWLISSCCSFARKQRTSSVDPRFQYPRSIQCKKKYQTKLLPFQEHLRNSESVFHLLYPALIHTSVYIYICKYKYYTYINTLQNSSHSKTKQTSATKKDLKRRCNILTRSLASRFRRLTAGH